LACRHNEPKIILTYSGGSQMGMGTARCFLIMDPLWVSGARLFQSISHGLISTLLFFLNRGSIYVRTGSTRSCYLGVNARQISNIGLRIFVFGGLALLGLPGLSSFMGEFWFS